MCVPAHVPCLRPQQCPPHPRPQCSHLHLRQCPPCPPHPCTQKHECLHPCWHLHLHFPLSLHPLSPHPYLPLSLRPLSLCPCLRLHRLPLSLCARARLHLLFQQCAHA